eukprot:4806139-Pleurochrysis_carterae.AAC.1
MPSGRSKGPEKSRRRRRAAFAGLTTTAEGRKCAGAAMAGSEAKGDGEGSPGSAEGSLGGCSALASTCSARAGVR